MLVVKDIDSTPLDNSGIYLECDLCKVWGTSSSMREHECGTDNA